MDEPNQKYCVVATVRVTKKRQDVTGALSLADAEQAAKNYQSYQHKKHYVYPKIAKFPYKRKK